jgi:hypothetical protein
MQKAVLKNKKYHASKNSSPFIIFINHSTTSENLLSFANMPDRYDQRKI